MEIRTTNRARRARIGAVLASAFVTTLLLSGCGDTSANGGSADGADAVVVAMNNFGNEASLAWNNNAIDGPVWDHVYDTLTVLDPETRSIEPGLAESWEISEDETTYTFVLREGVLFHDGDELTAEDVAYTLERMLEPESGGSAALGLQSIVSGVEVVDDLTVRIVMDEPNWSLLERLAGSAWITQKAYVEEVGDEKANDEPMGTGPYKFESSTPGSEIVFTAFDNGYEDVPAFSTLTLRAIADSSTQLSALQAGEIDVMQVSGDAVALAEGSGANIWESPNANLAWVTLPGLSLPGTNDYCPECPWVGDPADPTSSENARLVRHALALAIDKQALIDTAFGGYGSLDSFGYYVGPGFPGYSDDWAPLEYDPEQAQELLTEAGYPDGFTLPMMVINSAGNSELAQPIAQFWEAIGVDVELGQIEQAAITSAASSREADYAFVYQNPGELATTSLLGISSDQAFRFVVNDAATDEAIAAIRAEGDTDARGKLVQELQDRLIDQQYGIQIGWRSATFAASDKIGSWTMKRGIGALSNLETLAP